MSDPAAAVDELTDVAASPECRTHVHTQTHSREVKSADYMYGICHPAQWEIFQLGRDILMSQLANRHTISEEQD